MDHEDHPNWRSRLQPVQISRRFIQRDQFRLQHHHTRQRHLLLLSQTMNDASVDILAQRKTLLITIA